MSVRGPALPQQRKLSFWPQFPSSCDFTASGCRWCSWLQDVLGQEFLPAPGLLLKSEIQAGPQFPDTCLNHFHCSKAYPAFPPLTTARGVWSQVVKDQTPKLQTLEDVGLGPGLQEPRSPPSSLVGELPKCATTSSFNNSGACSQTSTLSFILLFIVTCKINNTLDWRL